MIRVWASTCFLVAISTAALSQPLVPTSIDLDISGNRILEPGEGVPVYAYWHTPGPIFLPGGAATLSNFTGPTGATYTIVDGTAIYGDFGPGYPPPGYPPHTCHPVDCYAPVALRITAATRPVQHWDATVLEGLWMGTITKTWTLHVGATFTDVPTTSGFYRFVETIVHKDVTGGCSPTAYCPAAPTSRQAMAVYLLVAREPRGYTPPACGATPLFPDVPVSSPFCPWVEELARRGVTAGCGGGYCPSASVNRQEMAVFILRTAYPGQSFPPCTANPYLDVPAASPFCPWIRELTNRGIVSGCGGGNYCPTADVTREQMSVFLTVTFGLTLYGV